MSTDSLTDTHAQGNRLVRWSRRNWVAIVLVLVSLVYGGAVTVLHDEAISPIDEVVYLDYTYKAFDEGFVREGEKFGYEVAQVIACEGVVPHGTFGQTCGSSSMDSKLLPNEGFTTGAAYLPVYFWITRIVGDPIHSITGIGEVTAWRLSGLLWLGIGLWLFVGLLRRWNVPETTTLSIGLLFIASPYVWWTYTYLSTDVTAFLFGTLMLSATVDAIRGTRSAWWLLPIALGAVLFKITNLLPLGLVLLYLLIDTFVRRTRGSRSAAFGQIGASGEVKPLRLWIPIGASVVIAAALQLVWMRVFPLLAVSDVRVDQGVAAPLGGTELLRLATGTLGGAITHNPAAGIFPTAPFAYLYAPLGWVCIAGVLGALMVLRWDAERGPVVWATAIASVSVLPLLAIVMYFATHSYFPLPARYAAGLLPAILLVVGLMLRNRVTALLFAAFSVILMAVGIVLAIYIGANF